MYLLLIICVIILAILYIIRIQYHGSKEIGKYIKCEVDNEEAFKTMKHDFGEFYVLNVDICDDIFIFLAENGIGGYNDRSRKVSGFFVDLKKNALIRTNKLYNEYITDKKEVKIEGKVTVSRQQKGVKKVKNKDLAEKLREIKDNIYPVFNSMRALISLDATRDFAPTLNADDLNVDDYDIFEGTTALLSAIIQGSFCLSFSLLKARALRKIVCDNNIVTAKDVENALKDMRSIIYGKNDEKTSKLLNLENYKTAFDTLEKRHPYNNTDNDLDIYSMAAVINFLIDKGANVNCYHLNYGFTPLHIACMKNEPVELIAFLIKKGAYRYATCRFSGKTPHDYIREHNPSNPQLPDDVFFKKSIFCADYNKAADLNYNPVDNRDKIMKLFAKNNINEYKDDWFYLKAK